MHRERYSPQDTARHVTDRLAAARRGASSNSINVWWGRLRGDEPRWVGTWRELVGDDHRAWRIGHHAGRLFALREQAREEYERTHWLMQRWDGAMRALARGGER